MKLLNVLLVMLSVTIVQVRGQTPNFVVVMTDDLDKGMLDEALTRGFMPNLENNIIQNGTTFSRSFVTNSLCCPSRASFLTGQYPHNHGVQHNLPPLGGVGTLDDSSTLGTWLQAAGYATGYVGKYLNTYGMDILPNNEKDDETYLPPGWTDWQALVDPTTYRVYGYTINDNGNLVDYGSDPGDYQTDVLAARATDFIRENSAVPFFLMVTPLAPHSESAALAPISCDLPGRPLGSIHPAPRHEGMAAGVSLPQGASFNEADVSDKPGWFSLVPLLSQENIDCLETLYRHKVESLLAVDDMIGTILSELNTSGVLTDTIVIFSSDNGFLFGEHRAIRKGYPYEESIGVPLMMAGPGIPQQTSSHLVLNQDLAPTIAHWAGATPTIEVDGRSLVPFFQDSSIPWRQRFLVQHWKRSNDELLPGYTAIRTADDLKLIRYDIDATSRQRRKGDQEMYDLNNDASELDSVHGDNTLRKSRKALDQNLEDLAACVGVECRNAEDE